MSTDNRHPLDRRIAWLLYFAFPRMTGVKKHPPITPEILLLEMEGLLKRATLSCSATGTGRGSVITFERTKAGLAFLQNALIHFRPAFSARGR